ncbi:MAG TPA: SLC13 family permease [Blastocatellia bacterium]|nr:SLC13 family permease [Blastocatellia bacterium]
MTLQIAIVLALLALSVVLFATEKLSVDIITLLLIMALVMLGVLTPAEAFAGFSNDIIIILCSIFVISGALQRSGVMDALGARLRQVAGGSANRLLLAVMSVVSGTSAFMNNTTVTAIFVPPVLGTARQSRISPSKLLMPVAFASILGGTCTLIGTSTNVAVSGYIEQAGMRPLGLFEITPVGLVITVVGIAYMMLIGRRLLPDHPDESLTEEYNMREYLSEIVLRPDSHLIGQRIFESDLSKMDFRILEVIRGKDKFLPDGRTRIEPEDILLVEGKIEDLIKVKETAGIEIKADLKLGDKDLQSDEIKMFEVLVTPQSDLIGRTLKEADFRARYGMTALAINRHGQPVREKIGRIRLRMGDLLLVQGPADRVDFLRRTPDLWILEELNPALYRKGKGLYTVAFFAAAIVVGAVGWLPLSVCFLAAAVLTVLFRCISVDEAYEFIDWRLIILIGGMTAFGTAMTKTGAAAFLAAWIVRLLQPFGEMVILAGFFLLTMILTQPMSNAAAALVVLPVAIETAQGLGANERTFAIAIMLAASVSFVTPFEPSCILVYGPGRYRFIDFVKIGLLLTILLMAVVLFLLPMFWPMHPV